MVTAIRDDLHRRPEMSRIKHTWRRLSVVAVASVALAACGGGDDGGDGGGGATAEDGTIQMEAGDLFFEPEEYSAEAGQLEIVVENVGAVEHDVVIEEAGDASVVHVAPGETGSGTIDLEAGTYTVYCSIPGHREAGMEATLNVS